MPSPAPSCRRVEIPESVRRSSSAACAATNEHLTVDPTAAVSPARLPANRREASRMRLCDRPSPRLTRSTAPGDSDCSEIVRAVTRHRRRRLSARRATVVAVVVFGWVAARHRHGIRPATPRVWLTTGVNQRLCVTPLRVGDPSRVATLFAARSGGWGPGLRRCGHARKLGVPFRTASAFRGSRSCERASARADV